MPVENLISVFLESLGTEKGFSDNTCRGYRNDLEEFLKYLTPNRRSRGNGPVDIGGVDNLAIRGYLGYLHKHNKKRYLVYMEDDDTSQVLWKSVDDMPCIIEYDCNF